MLTGGGAESAELAHRGMSRRQLLRRAVGVGLAITAAESVYGALTMLYPNLAGKFGSTLTLLAKSAYPAAQRLNFAIGQRGVFHETTAKAYIVHLAPGGSTTFLLGGSQLTNQMAAENWVKDTDGSYWIAIYQVCVHLGCVFPFRDDCKSFKCPCHGSHYNVDGEYLDGPAPRSADRFYMSFVKGKVVVDTGLLNQHVERPDAATRILPPPGILCASA